MPFPLFRGLAALLLLPVLPDPVPALFAPLFPLLPILNCAWPDSGTKAQCDFTSTLDNLEN